MGVRGDGNMEGGGAGVQNCTEEGGGGKEGDYFLFLFLFF